MYAHVRASRSVLWAVAWAPLVFAHEYMGFPPCRTKQCQVNGMIMGYRSDNPTHSGTTELQNIGTQFGTHSGGVQGDPADPELVKHLFRYNYAYEKYACGGSPIVVNKPLGVRDISTASEL